MVNLFDSFFISFSILFFFLFNFFFILFLFFYICFIFPFFMSERGLLSENYNFLKENDH